MRISTKKAGTKTVTAETLWKLEYLVSTCEPCLKIMTAPKRYHVAMGVEHTRFKAQVYIDFMYTEGYPVLHIVDDATHLSASQFVQPLTSESVWKTILTLWEAV